MKKSPRIPVKIEPFNSYLNNTDDFLQSLVGAGPDHNWERLGVATGDAAEWHTRRQHWSTVLYPKYSNKDTRTKTVTEQVKNFRKDFSVFGNPVLDTMAS